MPTDRNVPAIDAGQTQPPFQGNDFITQGVDRPISLYDRIYFSPVRNLGTHAQCIVFAALLFGVTFGMAMITNYFSMRAYHPLMWTTYAEIGLVFLYMFYRYLLPYRRTGMMLLGDGRARWSIHMAPHLGFRRLYARTRDGFMERGAAAIVQAAAAVRPGAIIVLESHRLGEKKWRRQHLRALSIACPMPLRIREGPSKKSLAWTDAWHLNRLKGFRQRHLGKEHGKPIRAGDPKGMIVVWVPAHT